MKRILLNWWTLTIVTTVVVILVLAIALPLVLHPLRPLWIRLLLGGLTLAIWGVFAVLRVLSARKKSTTIADALARIDPGDVEAKALADRMNQAVAALKQNAGKNRDYLYSRPWYVIIGPPGAGKTTALLNSGLRFPYSETALKGVGGTRNLDFWFADEAVLVDTAGRYTTQDSNERVDGRGWESFLGLLRRNRPLQPINGVLIAIGVDLLLQSDQAALDAHAAAVRRRLTELRRTLEVSAPVYVLFTKADLLAGFSEYFDDLDVEGRRAVLGSTLDKNSPADAVAVADGYDAFLDNLTKRSAKRLQEEPDLRRRSLILGFPSQIEAVRARALRFIDSAFPQNDPTAATMLRGFYFTSGVQEGAPLDRVLSGVASAYDPGATATTSGRGRAYFLNRLLNEVVFAEAGLARTDDQAVGRRRMAILGGLAATAAVVLVTLALWAVSFIGNRSYQNELAAAAVVTQQEALSTGIDLVQVRDSDPDLEQVLTYLRQLRTLPGGYHQRRNGGAPLLRRMGLQQSAHSRAAEEAYLTGLQRVLLPRLLLRLEDSMHQNLSNPMPLYDALKVYLTLGGRHQGAMDKNAAISWFVADWEQSVLAGVDRAAVRQEMQDHLRAMLDDDQIGRVWPESQADLDGALITQARSAVQVLTPAERAYAILRRQGMGRGEAWRASTILNAEGARAFALGETVLGLSVPHFFTKDGYQTSFRPGLMTVQATLQREQWVLGDQPQGAARAGIGDLQAGVARLYARDYIAAWTGVIDQLRPAPYFQDPLALAALIRSSSPLVEILTKIGTETRFGGDAVDTAAQAAGAAVAAKTPKVVRTVAAAATSGHYDAGAAIEAAFAELHRDLGDGQTPGALQAFVDAIRAAGSANASTSLSVTAPGGDGLRAQLATAMGNVTTASLGLSAMLQPFATAVTAEGQNTAISANMSAVTQTYLTTILPSCRNVTELRYPFVDSAAREASSADMIRVFGMNGEIDAFARSRLSSLLDTTGSVWRWRTDDPLAAGLDPLSADQFRRAAMIRDLLTEGLQLDIEGAAFGSSVTAAEIVISGVSYRFEPGMAGRRSAVWSLTSVPEARVVLHTANGPQVFTGRGEGRGLWALFRLMDSVSSRVNDGPDAVRVTFGSGGAFATFRIIMPQDRNPFRGGVWAFRCPPSL